jgi:hypothetical protein
MEKIVDPTTGRDKRYNLIKPMLKVGYINTFTDIFHYIPKTVVARDLSIKSDRFNALMQSPDEFTLRKLITLANFLDLSIHELIDLVLSELDARAKHNGSDL